MTRGRSFRHRLLASRVTGAVLHLVVSLTGVVPIVLLSENLDTDVGLLFRLKCVVGVGAWVFYSGAMADGLLCLADTPLFHWTLDKVRSNVPRNLADVDEERCV